MSTLWETCPPSERHVHSLRDMSLPDRNVHSLRDICILSLRAMPPLWEKFSLSEGQDHSLIDMPLPERNVHSLRDTSTLRDMFPLWEKCPFSERNVHSLRDISSLWDEKALSVRPVPSYKPSCCCLGTWRRRRRSRPWSTSPLCGWTARSWGGAWATCPESSPTHCSRTWWTPTGRGCVYSPPPRELDNLTRLFC